MTTSHKGFSMSGNDPTVDFSINGKKSQGNCKISRKLVEIWRKLLSDWMKNGTLILIQQQCVAINPKPVRQEKKRLM